MSSYTSALNPLGYREALPKPSPAELQDHYSKKYYQNAQGTYAADYSEPELRYFHNVARVALETARQLDLQPSLLDLGCGEGFFAKAFLDFRWSVSCCDFSAFGITRHNPELLPHFSAGDIVDQVAARQAAGDRFGLVNLQNVLEHVIDPQALLRDLKPLLGDHSALRVRVPNDYSDFQQALVEAGHATSTWFSPPEHLSYFNKQGLRNILEHCGYRILSLQADFPIELFLANAHANYWKDRTRGKAAHQTRVFCENHLIDTNVADYIEYASAAAKLGFGRELIAYARPA